LKNAYFGEYPYNTPVMYHLSIKIIQKKFKKIKKKKLKNENFICFLFFVFLFFF